MKRLITTSLVVLMFMAVAGNARAAVLFEDNFDSYTGYTHDSLFDVAPTLWRPDGLTSGTPEFWVGDWFAGKAFYQNSYWAEDVIHMALANMGGTESDYVVSAEVWEEPGARVDWCIGGRESDTTHTYARLKASIDGNNVLYATLLDSTGATISGLVADEFVPSEVVEMELTLVGGQVTGVVTHNGHSLNIDMTTTVTGAGDAGFGGIYTHGYAKGRFDNFVVSEIPEPATICLLSLGFLIGLRKRK